MKRLISILLSICLISTCFTTFAVSNQPSEWAKSIVSSAISKGIVPKKLQSNYQDTVTRSEFTSLIYSLWEAWAAEGISSVSEEKVNELSNEYEPFTDCKDKSVLFCASLGIVDGVGNNQFLPNAPVTRQQAAKILQRACSVLAEHVVREDDMITTAFRGITSWQLPHIWADGDEIRSWARNEIMWCYRHNVMSGVGENNFLPNGSFTREQAIATVLRLYYENGRAIENAQNPKDFYPIYEGVNTRAVSYWLDSSLEKHSTDELGHLPNPDSVVGVIIASTGVGATRFNIIDKAGNRLLRDLWDADGYFSDVKIFYPYAEVRYNGEVKLVDLTTNEVYEGVSIKDYISPAPVLPTPLYKGSVVEENGFYHIVSGDGKALSKEYRNKMERFGENLYIGWVSDSPRKYDILYCDGENEAKVLRTEEFRFNNQVHSLGGGLYAVQNTDKKITVFDVYGDTIGEIVSDDDDIVLYGSAGGLLWTSSAEQNEVYYTPSGIAVHTKSVDLK